jgi:tripartite-type tricarboxylate transporter receptor subunit TctC
MTVAESFPVRPIRLLVAFSPGGGSDTSARIVALKLGELLGQQVVVDNRPGAAGNIATEIAVRAQPDGYTLLWGFSAPLVVNPSLYRNLPFDTERDLEPIALVASSQYMLLVHPSIPATSVKELIAYAKSRPGQLRYASAGVGTPHHLAAELFKNRTGIDITHVTYKGGAPASVAVMSGEVQIHFGSFSAALPYVKAKRLTALAVTGPERSPEAPELPTMQQSGFDGFDVRSWFAVLAPARTPRNIVTRLNQELLKILAVPDVQERLKRTGVYPTGSTPQELAAYIKTEKTVWAKVIKDAGIRAE